MVQGAGKWYDMGGTLILLEEAAQLHLTLPCGWKGPRTFFKLHPIQRPQCQEGRAATGLAWLQTSATWLLGGLGWD